MNFNPEFHWQKEQKQELIKRVTKISLIVFVVLLICVFIAKKCHFVSYVNMSLDSSIPENTKALTQIINVDKILSKNSYEIKIVDDFKNNLSKIINSDRKKIDLLLGYFGKNVYIIENEKSQAIVANVSNFSAFSNIVSLIGKEDRVYVYNKSKIYPYSIDIKENLVFNNKNGKIFLSNFNDYSIIISNDEELLKNILDKNSKDGKFNYVNSIKQEFSEYFKNDSGIKIKIIDYNIDNSKTFIKNLGKLYKNTKNNKIFLNANFSNQGIDVSFSNNEFLDINIDSHNINLEEFVLLYQNIDKKLSESVNFGSNIEKYLNSIIQIPYTINVGEELTKLNPPFSFFVYKNNNFIFYGKDAVEIEYIYKTLLAHLNPSKRSIKLPDSSYATEYYINPKAINLIEQDENGIKFKNLSSSSTSNIFLAECSENSVISNNKDIIYSFCNNTNSYNYTQNTQIKEIMRIDLSSETGDTGYLNGFKDKFRKFQAINLSNNDNIEILFRISN